MYRNILTTAREVFMGKKEIITPLYPIPLHERILAQSVQLDDKQSYDSFSEYLSGPFMGSQFLSMDRVSDHMTAVGVALRWAIENNDELQEECRAWFNRLLYLAQLFQIDGQVICPGGPTTLRSSIPLNNMLNGKFGETSNYYADWYSGGFVVSELRSKNELDLSPSSEGLYTDYPIHLLLMLSGSTVAFAPEGLGSNSDWRLAVVNNVDSEFGVEVIRLAGDRIADKKYETRVEILDSSVLSVVTHTRQAHLELGNILDGDADLVIIDESGVKVIDTWNTKKKKREEKALNPETLVEKEPPTETLKGVLGKAKDFLLG